MVKRSGATSLLILTLVMFGGRFLFTFHRDGHILIAEYMVCLIITISVLIYGIMAEKRRLRNETYEHKDMIKWSRAHKLTIVGSVIIILLTSHLIYLELSLLMIDSELIQDLIKPYWFDILIRFYVIVTAALTALRSALVVRAFSQTLNQKQMDTVKEDSDYL
ncbi:hypothetical protein M3231_21735 [Neobacillus mesonae]|nr:hypothetical protein [Neobacillus mesonae]